MQSHERSLGDRIRRNAGWLIGSALVQRGVAFVVGVIMARLLVPEDFGLVATMAIFTGFAGFFAAGGMGDALVRAPSLKDTDYGAVFTAQLAICLVIFGIFYAVAPAFARWFGEPIYETLLRVSALSFLLRPFLNVPQSQLARGMQFRDLSIIRVVTLVASSIASIALALRGAGAWALVLGGLAGAITTLPIMIWVARWRPGFFIDVSAIKRLGTVGIKFTLNHIILHWTRQIGYLLISRLMGLHLLGLYTRADGLAQIPRELIIAASNQTLFRGFAEIQDNVDQSRYLFLRSITLLSVYTMPAYVTLWWIADPFVPFVYGEQWAGTVEPLRILALGGLLLIGNQSGAILAAQGYLTREIKINIEVLIVTIAACVLGSRYGITGIAVAFTATTLYSRFRLYQGASVELGTTIGDLVHALTPAYLFNTGLFFALGLADYLALSPYRDAQPLLYIICMSAIALIVYSLLFFFIPTKGLESEVERWKKMLREVLNKS